MVVFPSVGAVLFGLSVACCRGRALYLSCHGISKLCEILSPLQKKERSGWLSPGSRKGLRKRIPVEPCPGVPR